MHMLIHTVRKGDTMWQIAKAHNISLEALIAANPQIADPNYILPGSIINIPCMWQPEPPPEPEEQRPYIYIAAEGDNLANIAKNLLIPLAKMVYYNRIYAKTESLPAKTRIIIPSDESYPADMAQQRYPRRR